MRLLQLLSIAFTVHQVVSVDSDRHLSKGDAQLEAETGTRVGRALKKVSKGSTDMTTVGADKTHNGGDDNGGHDGGGNSPPQSQEGCVSEVAHAIRKGVPEATTRNPSRCCNFNGPTAVFVTHAQLNDLTGEPFEPFWNTMYEEIASNSELFDVCFVMTGYNNTIETDRTLSQILIEVNTVVSSLPVVPAMMSTDPTDNLDLANYIRTIWNNPAGPSIGVFNAGLRNLQTESLVSGQDRLPFVGYAEDSLYGTEAADVTLRLLKGEPANPICFNGRPDLAFIGLRCAAYYTDVTDDPPSRLFGVTCRADSSVDAIAALLIELDINAVYSHIDCCAPVAEAVEQVRATGKTIVLGCQDEDKSSGGVDFVTGQPIELQAYQSSSWVNLPVIVEDEGGKGNARDNFPSTRSTLRTEVYNRIIF